MRVRGRLVSFVVLAGVLAGMLVPATPAGAGTTFHFYGAGYGHGVGMSAYGVWGMAQDGWSTGGILHHFYPNTAITKHKVPSYIRVGLVQGAGSIPIKAVSGKAELRVGDPSSGEVAAVIPSGQTYTVVVKSSRYWIKRSNGTWVGNHGWGSVTNKLFSRFAP